MRNMKDVDKFLRIFYENEISKFIKVKAKEHKIRPKTLRVLLNELAYIEWWKYSRMQPTERVKKLYAKWLEIK